MTQPPIAPRLAALGLALGVPLAAVPARAEPTVPTAAVDPKDGAPASPAKPLDAERMEYAGFPILAGNTDIGVMFGGAATITHFHGDDRPYQWNLDILLATSLKHDFGGTRFVQQNQVLRLDLPAFFGGRARLDSRASFDRTVNEGYYGLGDATSAAPAPGASQVAGRYQFLFEEARWRNIVRVHTSSPLDVTFGLISRWENPAVYAATKLAEDRADVLGVRGAFLQTLSGGVMYDTRDSEFITTRGLFYQIGVGGTVGSADGIRYGEAAAVLSHYVPLGGPFLFAERVVGSFQFGNVPFYDQARGGVFEPQRLFGGENGVRGVPQGRYAGLAKVLSNTEVRAPGPRFSLWKQRFRLGATAFFDVGRVFSEYAWSTPVDGRGLGLKYGVGGGLFLQWGEAAIFRLDVAYSPDAVAENPGLPVGIYVSDGLMF